MKIIVLITCLLVLSGAAFSQQTNPSQPLSREDYLKKSKTKKTVGWIMLGGGVAMTTIGLVTANKQVNDDPINAITNSSGSTILMLVGIGTALGSIPFFIASGKNRRKAAASVSFKMENATIIQQWAVSNSRYPAVAIQIRL